MPETKNVSLNSERSSNSQTFTRSWDTISETVRHAYRQSPAVPRKQDYPWNQFPSKQMNQENSWWLTFWGIFPLREATPRSWQQWMCSPDTWLPCRWLPSDKGTVFVSEVFKNMANDLNIKIDHATVKHRQTIGALERCHSSLKRFLNIQSGANFSNWHRRLSFATYAYNTTYHTAIATTPTHRRDNSIEENP